jgi:hypothetical protein
VAKLLEKWRIEQTKSSSQKTDRISAAATPLSPFQEANCVPSAEAPLRGYSGCLIHRRAALAV